MSLEKKILELIKENRVITEAGYGPGENETGKPLTISPTDVKPGYEDLGAPIVSPTQGSAPDYTRGVPTQTPYPTSKPVSGDIIGNEDAGKGKVGYPGISGPQVGGPEWIVREEEDKDEKGEDDKDKDDEKDMKEEKGENPFAKKDKDDKDDEKDEKKDKEDKEEVKEALDAIFAGEKLSEAFKKKASIVFEAAVAKRVKSTLAESKKQLVKENVQVLEAEKKTLATKVDQYLNYVVEQWMKENEIAIDRGIKTQLTEEFLIGLKKLFAENYIEVPQEKLDVVAVLAQKVQTLETKLNEQIDTNINLSNTLVEKEKSAAFAEISKGLADTQVEKLRGLAESVSFKDVPSYKGTLQTLKESYFSNKTSQSGTRVPLTEDVTVVEENKENEQTEIKDSSMAAYVQALDRQVKS